MKEISINELMKTLNKFLDKTNQQTNFLMIDNFDEVSNKAKCPSIEPKLEDFDNRLKNSFIDNLIIVVPRCFDDTIASFMKPNDRLSIFQTKSDNLPSSSLRYIYNKSFKSLNALGNQEQNNELRASFVVKKRHFTIMDKSGQNRKIILYTPEWLKINQVTTINSFFREVFYHFENELGIEDPLEKIKSMAKSISDSCKDGDLSGLFAIYGYKSLDNQATEWMKAYEIDDSKRLMSVINSLAKPAI
ncbi:MAG: hypothetical protein GX282_01680 [Campylobacteraceae bacterium]|nr:hypothetical protein [Campylobacteraceae bacterium]